VASGYNRTTRISPLHGALMAAALVNQGRLIDPTIVDWIAATSPPSRRPADAPRDLECEAGRPANCPKPLSGQTDDPVAAACFFDSKPASC
jgi:hypothetical protein